MKQREYYIDWLRIILIGSVFLYHVGMIFSSNHWHVKNNLQLHGMDQILSFLHVWRMPSLFLISGIGTFYALGNKSRRQYLKNRFNRLIIPFVAGIFILVPIQVYIEKIDQYDSLMAFYPHLFKGIYPGGNFTWCHLWFIFYLFVFSLVVSPFFKYIRGNQFKGFQQKLLKISQRKGGANVFLIPLVLIQAIIFPIFKSGSHYTYDFIFFAFGIIIFSNRNITSSLIKQRRIYLTETLVLTFIMLSTYYINYGNIGTAIKFFSSTVLALTCSMAVLGYSGTYLNFDSKFRKLANEATYPFYLIHQPVIVVTGYYIVPMDIHIFMKLILITILSFGFSISIYWSVIRPINTIRFIFGLKPDIHVARLMGCLRAYAEVIHYAILTIYRKKSLVEMYVK